MTDKESLLLVAKQQKRINDLLLALMYGNKNNRKEIRHKNRTKHFILGMVRVAKDMAKAQGLKLVFNKELEIYELKLAE